MIIDTFIKIPADVRKRAVWAIDALMNATGITWREVVDPEGEPSSILLRYGEKPDKRDVKANVILDVPFTPEFYMVDQDPHLVQVIKMTMVTGGNNLVSVEPDGETVICHFRADLFANVFFHLSRVEENLLTGQEVGGRFQVEHSLLRQVDLLHAPVVDELIDAFVDALVGACRIAGIPLLRKGRWPNDERMSLFLSHDVDRLRKWTPGRIIREMRGGLRRIIESGSSVIRGDDPYRSGFREVIEAEEHYGVRSTFYVGGRSSSMPVTERSDLSYRLHEERELVTFLSEVVKRGWEVGLHGSLTSFLSTERLQSEREELERSLGITVVGVRQHYLRFTPPDTWGCQEAAGFLYDATLGYADAEGFRAGTSLPFIPYDTHNDRSFTLIEVPLTVMDATLDGYRRYDARTAEERVFSLLSTVERHCGVFSFLLHQSALDTEEHPFMGELYRQFLRHIPSGHTYIATGREIARWWRQRMGMMIQDVRREENGWRWVWQSSVGIDRITLEVDGVRTFRSVNVKGCRGEVCQRGNESAVIRLFNVPAQQHFEITITL
ncbi:MAG: polysaccharide deacetylase family protein [Candidatus Latescibacteria bacterium]|nr:polysaccharide deacetylase family protein [Candidatus Latescibacterota bacterium]